ncbi:hypothetical protein DS884_02790 [Tenacibaculum sp. E3R01]|uniref:hypothetical protein n=1 Tax=Tenacibaculum sp. E3R01 TaxID=2267227 RepID=UPI000DEA5735|nr:hypothetical protein [Tenacibaculum sp. E3R01]RBW61947.1 hypothetical protein DS884_02790 [Tenacibaculum sp. E3R01]
MSEIDKRIQEKIKKKEALLKEKIEALQKSAKSRIDDLEKPNPSDFEAAIDLQFDIKWKITSIKFDIPKFSMELEKISFDIPEVKMETEKISFDVPAIRMKRACLFKKPEFHGFPPKVYMKCVYGNKPEIYTKRVEFKTDIPKFSSKRIEIKFDKPVVKMETIEIKMHLPQFYLTSVEGEIKNYSEDVQEIGNDMNSEAKKLSDNFSNEINTELKQDIKDLFDEIQNSLIKSREEISVNYNTGITNIKTSIKRLKEANATDKVKELESQLAILITDFENALKTIDENLEDLAKEESEVFMNFSVNI